MRIVYGLNPGDRLTVADAQMRRWSRELGTRIRKCAVIHEYPHFILADFGAYRESINKASIHCKAVLIWKGWEEG